MLWNDRVWSQQPTASTSNESLGLGFQARHHTGADFSMRNFSSHWLSTLWRILTTPLYMPSATNWPFLVQSAHRMRDCTLCFCTALASGDHSPKSDAVHDMSCCVTGLYASFWIGSLWLYFSCPSASEFQMIMVLSAPPEAKNLPFEEYATVNTVPLCPRSDCSKSASTASYTSTRLVTATIICDPSGLKQMSHTARSRLLRFGTWSDHTTADCMVDRRAHETVENDYDALQSMKKKN
mmetsp:Transcript_18012/g.26404  ORF Transcript_18012/g.26404 Transcript_18012/m.26404 type:complete len:238 (-) Transcript_18012:142-855(-)